MKKVKKETNPIPAGITTGIRAEYHLNKNTQTNTTTKPVRYGRRNQELTTFESNKILRSIKYIYFCFGATVPRGSGLPHSQDF